MRRTAPLLALAAAGPLWAGRSPAGAEEMPVFRIEMKDGRITPDRLEVPANTRFKIEVVNSGATPVEFESVELKRERAVAAGDTGTVVIRNLDPGEYPFFDDFHPDAKAVIVAR